MLRIQAFFIPCKLSIVYNSLFKCCDVIKVVVALKRFNKVTIILFDVIIEEVKWWNQEAAL